MDTQLLILLAIHSGARAEWMGLDKSNGETIQAPVLRDHPKVREKYG
jgi:hypothetical protein